MAFKTWIPMSALIGLVVALAPPSASASAIVTEWLDQTVPAAKQTAWEPTISARFFALVHAAMYDAWTAYDPAAVGVFSGTALHGKGGLPTVANKREAVSHAAYQVLRELAPVRRRALAEYKRDNSPCRGRSARRASGFGSRPRRRRQPGFELSRHQRLSRGRATDGIFLAAD
jgi:hypothetical protein